MISILMPVKNAEPFLAECLESIQGQTCEDWELLAVDDSSVDASSTVLEAFARKDQRIKSFKNHGKGIIAALRQAYHASTGILITRMDADDRMPPQKLSILRKQLEALGPGNLTTGKVEYFSSQALGDGYRRYQDWLNKLVDSNSHYENIYKECVIPSPCWMVFREDLDRCQAFKPDRYPEDYDLCFRFYQAGLKVNGIDKTLHFWRDHPARTSRNDPTYADIHYFPLKMDYFLQTDHQAERPLVLWGAGRKGKQLAKLLNHRDIPFHWVTDNPKKIGHIIYDSLIVSSAEIEALTHPQVLIAIAIPQAQDDILSYLERQNSKPGKDHFLFC